MSELDVLKVTLHCDLNNVVYGYGNTLDEHMELTDKIFDEVENLLITIYKERYLKDAIQSALVPAYDGCGNRYVKCIHCGRILNSTDMIAYGDKLEVNLGICRECYADYERSDSNEEDYSDINEYLNYRSPRISHVYGKCVC